MSASSHPQTYHHRRRSGVGDTARSLTLFCLLFSAATAAAFVDVVQAFPLFHPSRSSSRGCADRLLVSSSQLSVGRGSGRGLGKEESSSSNSIPSPPPKTFGAAQTRPIRDLIDSEAAMTDFFTSRQDWTPFFHSLITLTPSSENDSISNNNNDNDDRSFPAKSYFRSSSLSSSSSDKSVSSSVLLPELSLNWDEAHTKPWKQQPSAVSTIPTDPNDRQVLAAFLDSMQQSLLDIPVTENYLQQLKQQRGEDVEDDYDDNDMHFLEEGRRLLTLSRFHVLRTTTSTTTTTGTTIPSSSSLFLESYDDLFRTCWTELYALRAAGKEHTGSLILLPDYFDSSSSTSVTSSTSEDDPNNTQTILADLRRFADLNLLRPLEWLGLHEEFEIASIYRPSSTAAPCAPAIRMIYKLADMPVGDNNNENEEEEE